MKTESLVYVGPEGDIIVISNPDQKLKITVEEPESKPIILEQIRTHKEKP